MCNFSTRSFSECTFSGFRKHLNARHAQQIEHGVESDIVDRDTVADNVPSQVTEVASSSQVSSSQDLSVTNRSIRDMCGSAIAQLRVSGVGQSTLNGCVLSMEEVVLEVQSQAEEAALKCLSSQDTSIKARTKQSFEKLENPFMSLNSDSRRNFYFKQKRKTFQPVEKVTCRQI